MNEIQRTLDGLNQAHGKAEPVGTSFARERCEDNELSLVGCRGVLSSSDLFPFDKAALSGVRAGYAYGQPIPTVHERTQFKEATMFRKLTQQVMIPFMTILRLVLGSFFLPWRLKKCWMVGGYGFSGTMNFFTTKWEIPAVFAFLAIAAEFFGSLGLILGLLARVAAAGIIVNMLVAILMFTMQTVSFHELVWKSKRRRL